MSVLSAANSIDKFEALIDLKVTSVNEIYDDEDNLGFAIYFNNGKEEITMHIIDNEVFIG